LNECSLDLKKKCNKKSKNIYYIYIQYLLLKSFNTYFKCIKIIFLLFESLQIFVRKPFISSRFHKDYSNLDILLYNIKRDIDIKISRTKNNF